MIINPCSFGSILSCTPQVVGGFSESCVAAVGQCVTDAFYPILSPDRLLGKNYQEDSFYRVQFRTDDGRDVSLMPILYGAGGMAMEDGPLEEGIRTLLMARGDSEGRKK